MISSGRFIILCLFQLFLMNRGMNNYWEEQYSLIKDNPAVALISGDGDKYDYI